MNAKLHKQLSGGLKQFLRYRLLIFSLVLVSVYGFIVWRIDTLRNAPPNLSVAASPTVPTPQIDPQTVAKIKQLQNNSVNVQTLFNQARNSPFQE